MFTNKYNKIKLKINDNFDFDNACLFILVVDNHGTKGIKQWLIPNDDPQNYPALNLQLVAERFEHST